MSLESMLDEERRDVLALLEGGAARRARGSASSATSGRAPSPFTNPRSPVRSMLDVGDPPPRSASVSSTNGGLATPGRPASIRSMLDVNTPTTPAIAATKSAQTSPTESNHRAHMSNNSVHRSLSDAASRPAAFGPRAGVASPEAAYQFSGYLPSNPGGPVIPKRNTLAGKKAIPSAMAEVVRGGDLSNFGVSRDRGRNHSIATTGISTAKSKSPHNRLGIRSNSPHLSPDPTKFTLKDGRVIDMTSAYRRLSDANLALSGGGLSSLSSKKNRRGTNSGDAADPHSARLEKDYTPIDGEDAVADSSDEDTHSSDEDRHRGRQKTGRGDRVEEDHPESRTIGMGQAKGPRTALSLMAAAEEERG